MFKIKQAPQPKVTIEEFTRSLNMNVMMLTEKAMLRTGLSANFCRGLVLKDMSKLIAHRKEVANNAEA